MIESRRVRSFCRRRVTRGNNENDDEASDFGTRHVILAPPRGKVLRLSCMDFRLRDDIVHFMRRDNLEKGYDTLFLHVRPSVPREPRTATEIPSITVTGKNLRGSPQSGYRTSPNRRCLRPGTSLLRGLRHMFSYPR